MGDHEVFKLIARDCSKKPESFRKFYKNKPYCPIPVLGPEKLCKHQGEIIDIIESTESLRPLIEKRFGCNFDVKTESAPPANE